MRLNILMYVIFASVRVGADDLSTIYSSRSLQQLHQVQVAQIRSSIALQTCRLQVVGRKIPTACLSTLSLVERKRACRRVDSQNLSLQTLDQALRLKIWDKSCHKHLQLLRNRKFYQERGDQEIDRSVGLRFETSPGHAKHYATHSPHL